MSLAILRRASVLAVITFALTGAVNALPQLYLLKHHPDHKSFYLSAILFAGTVASILGVAFSRARLGARPSPRVALACVAPFLGVALEVRPLWLYVIGYVLFRFTGNWLFNQLDHGLLAAAGEAGAKAHATATAGFAILGQLTGPAVFVGLAGHPWLSLGVIMTLGIWGVFAVRHIAPPAPEERRAESASTGDSMAHDVASSDGESSQTAGLAGSRRATSYLLYCLLMLTGVAGFFSQLIFLLRDYVGIESAGRVGGLWMMGTGVVSIVTVLISSRRGGGLSRGAFLVPPLLSAAVILVFALRPGLPGLLLMAVLAGISGGRLLLSTRLCASTWEGPPGRAAMLSLYNNLSNGAALVAYSLTGAASLSLGEASPPYHLTLLALLFMLFSLAGILCAASPFSRSPAS